LKQRLRNALGSDSEEDNQSLTDVMELSCSDIEEEEEEPPLIVSPCSIKQMIVSLKGRNLPNIKGKLQLA